MKYRTYINRRVNIKVYIDGHVEGFVNGKPVKVITEDKCGHIVINIGWQHGRLHRIVYCLFNELEDIPNGYVIHHINKKPWDNRLDNLIMLTHQEHHDIHYEDIYTEENRQIISNRMKDSNPMKNSETAKKVGDAQRGRKTGDRLTDEGRQSLSDRMKENNPMKNPETVAKMLETRGEIHLSEEAKHKISKSLTGKKRTKEQRKHYSEALSGKGNPAYGRKWMHNNEYKYYAKPEEIECLIALGFEFGFQKSLPKYVIPKTI